MNARAGIEPIVLDSVRLATDRWRRKILTAVSGAVCVSYMNDSPELATTAMQAQWSRLDRAAQEMAERLVDGLVNAGAPLEPVQAVPAMAKEPIHGGYLSSAFMRARK
jgi:hypothetical protein